MKNLIITCALLFISLSGFSKFYLPDLDLVQEAERRILLVELKEIDDDVLWSLNNETQKQRYKDYVNSYNIAIQDLFERHWTWCDQEVRFVPKSQLEQISDRDLIRFAVFNSVREIRAVEEQGTYKLTKFNYFYMAKNGLIETVFDMAFNTDESVSEGELALAVKGFNHHLKAVKEGADIYADFIDINRNIQVLQKKVLFIDETFNKVDPGLIGRKYPNGFKVVKPEMIKKVLDEQKLVGAVTKVSWNKRENHFYCTVFDAANGRILAVLDFCGKSKKKKKDEDSGAAAYASMEPSYSTTASPEEKVPNFKFLTKKLYGKITSTMAQKKFLK